MMSNLARGRATDVAAVLVFLALWGASVGYLAWSGGDWTFPLIALGVFGVALSAIAWLTTRGADAPRIEVRRPVLESGAVLIYLTLYALVFLGWGLGAAREAVPDERAQEGFVLVLKLLVHVVGPALLLLALGAKIAPLFQAGLKGRKFWRTLIIMGAILIGLLMVVSPSLKQINELNAPPTLLAWAIPAAFIWLAIEAGLCEEFLYRAVLQTRLTALFNSAWMGIGISSILFGLAHAPGLYLRGGPGVDGWSTDVFQVIAYTIATLAPLSLLFGFIYARTKSLLLVVLLHAAVDVLPNTASFVRTWVG
jgi:membrane protease YdiL (CAAX protease family)